MSDRYYKNTQKSDAVYNVPDFVFTDFSDIPGKEFLVQEGDRLDVIAEQVYGSSRYWRAIALYNGIGYFFEVVPGEVIKLPFDINKVMERI